MNNPRSLLTNEEVLEARQLYFEGYRPKDIAIAYGYKLENKVVPILGGSHTITCAPHNFYRMIQGECYAQVPMSQFELKWE